MTSNGGQKTYQVPPVGQIDRYRSHTTHFHGSASFLDVEKNSRDDLKDLTDLCTNRAAVICRSWYSPPQSWRRPVPCVKAHKTNYARAEVVSTSCSHPVPQPVWSVRVPTWYARSVGETRVPTHLSLRSSYFKNKKQMRRWFFPPPTRWVNQARQTPPLRVGSKRALRVDHAGHAAPVSRHDSHQIITVIQICLVRGILWDFPANF